MDTDKNFKSENTNPFGAEFFESVKNELFNDILPFWEKYSRDTRAGKEGFYASISNSGLADTEAPRSIVMTSRFLWTYSAAARQFKKPELLDMADFAYRAIVSKYWDSKNGGTFWTVYPDGKAAVSKKQIYGQAFCCYGLSEYAAAIKELRQDKVSEEAMNYALEIFNYLEKYALDTVDGGYLEACAQDWSPTDDMILSSKDMNCPKSMNTNLHVMEAYTNLYRTLPLVFPQAKVIRAGVGSSLAALVRLTVNKILMPNAHLSMFFDIKWTPLSDEISFGHDIEASWLLWEAACELDDEGLKSQIRETVIKIAETALTQGFDHQNGCMENFLRSGQKGKVRDRTRVWWNQAEAMNGFYNAWEMTGESKYSAACLAQWKWIQNFQKDKKGGEWWNAVDVNGKPILTEDKGGNWKTSYHNGRTCLELLRRSGYSATGQ